MVQQSSRVKIVHYVAHFLAAAILLLYLTFIVGEGILGNEGLPPPWQIQIIPVELMLAGLLIAWKWNGIGGAITLSGYIIFAFQNRGLLLLTPFALFPAASILYLVSGWMGREPRTPSLSILREN